MSSSVITAKRQQQLQSDLHDLKKEIRRIKSRRKKRSERKIAAIQKDIVREIRGKRRANVQSSHVLGAMIAPGRSSSERPFESVSRSTHKPLTLSASETSVLPKYRRKLGPATKYIREAIRGHCIEKASSLSSVAPPHNKKKHVVLTK